MSKGGDTKSGQAAVDVSLGLLQALAAIALAGGILSFIQCKGNPELAWRFKNRRSLVSLICAILGFVAIFFALRDLHALSRFDAAVLWKLRRFNVAEYVCIQGAMGGLVLLFSSVWLRFQNDPVIRSRDILRRIRNFKALERLMADPDNVPIGFSLKTYKPSLMSLIRRRYHVFVAGAPGNASP